MGSILVVDDDARILEVMSEMLRPEGHRVNCRFIGADATLANPFAREERISTVSEVLAD